MFKTSEEFQTAANRILDLVECQERGEISENKLLHEWKLFRRQSEVYFSELKRQANKNSN